MEPSKSVHIALQAIFGIGKTKAMLICELIGLSQSVKINQLKRMHVEQIRRVLSRYFIIGSDLERLIKLDIISFIKKTLSVIKDSSGKPILFCSLTPLSKKRNEGAKSHTFKKSGMKSLAIGSGTKWGTPVPPMQLFPVESGVKRKKSLYFSAKPWAVAQRMKQKKDSSFSTQGGALATRGKLKQQSKS